jgi:hypothetical protein
MTINVNVDASDDFMSYADKHEYSVKIKDNGKKMAFIDTSYQALESKVSKPGKATTKSAIMSSCLDSSGSLILKAKVCNNI